LLLRRAGGPLVGLAVVLSSGALAVPAGAVEQTAPLSADGRYRAYQTGLNSGVKVADRAAGSTDNASVDSDGRWSQADRPDLDWAGRAVVFSSSQPLVVDDTNATTDVYVRDRACPTSQRIPAGPAGGQPNGGSDFPAISGDGRYVAYISSASNLVAGDTNGTSDVFVTDRATGRAERVSLDVLGRQSTDRGFRPVPPAISADGRYVVFGTTARLTPDDTNDAVDLYRRDRVAGTTVRVSVSTTGAAGVEPNNPSISADGNLIAFDWRPPREDGTIDPQRQAWVRDVRAGTTETVTEWAIASDGRGLDPSISADGMRVAFAGNEMWGDEGRDRDIDHVFVYDRTSHLPFQFSQSLTPIHQEHVPALSANGRFVSWGNTATTGDVYDIGPGTQHPVPGVAAFNPPCPAPVRSAYRSAVMDDQPASYWRFGEVHGAEIAHDESQTRPGGELEVRGLTGAPGALAGDPDTGLSLDGVSHDPGGESVAIGYGRYDFAGHAPFTLEAWIRPRNLNSVTRRVFSSEGTRGGYLVGVRAGAGGLVFSRYVDGRWSTLSADITPGRWTHVVATYDTSQVMRLYVDGVRVKVRGALASTLSLPPMVNFDRQLVLGSLRSQWRFFAGEMDEVAVYDRALGPGRISAHYAAGAGAG
jgi:Tol biopolymer transport system component